MKARLRSVSTNQPSIGGLGMGSVVKLDGGKRVRMDDKVDFWPASGEWVALDQGADGQPSTRGDDVTSMMAFLKAERERAGQPVGTPAPRQSDRAVECNYCGKPAELHGGLAVYPDRKDLEDRQFWVCWACDAWVGCQRGTDRPFGALADTELRDARIAAHKAFDPVWQDGRLSKEMAYQWLSDVLAIPRERCQIGLMTLDECRRVSQAVWDRFDSIALR